jgi:hypothetical protein
MKLGIYLFMMLTLLPFAAQAGGFATIKAGAGNIDVKQEFAINQTAEDQDVFSMGMFGGYNFDSGLLVEAGFSGETSDDIFEAYDVFQLIGLLGYTFRLGQDFTFTPKAGFSAWELDTFQSGLFDLFGDGEDEEFSYDGTDPVIVLEGEYSLNKLLQFNLSYTHGSYDFGDLDSFRFGVEFDF